MSPRSAAERRTTRVAQCRSLEMATTGADECAEAEQDDRQHHADQPADHEGAGDAAGHDRRQDEQRNGEDRPEQGDEGHRAGGHCDEDEPLIAVRVGQKDERHGDPCRRESESDRGGDTQAGADASRRAARAGSTWSATIAVPIDRASRPAISSAAIADPGPKP